MLGKLFRKTPVLNKKSPKDSDTFTENKVIKALENYSLG